MGLALVFVSGRGWILLCTSIYAGFCRYVILPKDFEKGYKANVKKSDADFDFYR